MNRRLDYIDGLKGLAILLVMANHWVVYFLEAPLESFQIPSSFRLLRGGQYGVSLFFLVSGYTLYRSTLTRFVTDARPAWSFYLRRFWRIYPLWFAAQFLYQAHYGVTDLHEYWCCFLFLCAFQAKHAHLFAQNWSLIVEESFYLILPLIVLAGVSRPKRALSLLAFTLCLRFGWLLILKDSVFLKQNTYRELFPLAQWYNFAVGICLFQFADSSWGRRFKNWSTLRWLEPALIVLLLNFFGYADWGAGDLPHTLLFSLIFLMAMSPHSLIHRFTTQRWLRTLGIACYSLYLLHPLLMERLAGFFQPRLKSLSFFEVPAEFGFVITFPVFILAVIPLGYASAKYLERPLLKVPDRFFLRNQRAPKEAAVLP